MCLRFALVCAALGMCAAGCTVSGYYVSTGGTILAEPPPSEGLRVSAAHDLVCDPDTVRTYALDLGTTTGGGARRTRASVDVAEGCGKRAVYKESCADEPEPSA